MRKDTILFASLPSYAAVYIKPIFDNCNDIQDYINLYYDLLDISDNTLNISKKLCCDSVARYIYESLTNRSYESRIF